MKERKIRMARPLREKELYRAITKHAKSNDIRQGEKDYNALFSVIVSELSAVGEINLPKIGKLLTHRTGGEEKTFRNPLTGETFTKFVEPGYLISFQCSNQLKELINGKTKKPLSKSDPKYQKLKRDMEKYKDLQAQTDILKMLDELQNEEKEES